MMRWFAWSEGFELFYKFLLGPYDFIYGALMLLYKLLSSSPVFLLYKAATFVGDTSVISTFNLGTCIEVIFYNFYSFLTLSSASIFVTLGRSWLIYASFSASPAFLSGIYSGGGVYSSKFNKFDFCSPITCCPATCKFIFSIASTISALPESMNSIWCSSSNLALSASSYRSNRSSRWSTLKKSFLRMLEIWYCTLIGAYLSTKLFKTLSSNY